MRFILGSVCYVSTLAIVDGIFNRLIFREHKFLSYNTTTKQTIYRLWEWKVIGLLLLILLPLGFPLLVSYYIGGIKYLIVYIATFLFVPWDMLFGKIVFDNWLADFPSIALPYIGWIHVRLRTVMIGRILMFFLVLLFYVMWF